MNTAVDRALTAINQFDASDESSALVQAKIRGLIIGYDARWKNAGYTASHIEETLTAPLINPETNKKSRTFSIAGKLDLVAHLDGRSYVIDHKTTSQDITDPNASYWRQLAIEGQVSHYHLLAWQNGMKFDGSIWDVCRKPSIAPKKLSKAERSHVVANGTYFGFFVTDDDRAWLQTEERETLGMYSSRLAHDCTTERPKWYFQRRPVPRMDHELLEYAGDLWDVAQDMISARAKNRHLRNSGACMAYGHPCAFLGVCSGHDTIDSDKWKRRESVHPELPLLEGDGRSVITNSRIRSFQTCRRLHYHRYELGLERYDAEEREALVFGQLWHVSLEHWWGFYLAGDRHGTTEEHAGTPAQADSC